MIIKDSAINLKFKLLLENTILILKKDPVKREPQELVSLKKLLLNLPFFMQKRISDSDLTQIAQAFRFEKFEPGETIMQYGE